MADEMTEEKQRQFEEILGTVREIFADQYSEQFVLTLYKKFYNPTSSTEALRDRVFNDIVADPTPQSSVGQELVPYGPIKQDESTEPEVMEMNFACPQPSTSSKRSVDDSNMQIAMQMSLEENQRQPSSHNASLENPEQMIRDLTLTAGIQNCGNTCWFNCIVQMLYAIPSFRSLLYYCIPETWNKTPITNAHHDKRKHAELLLHLRSLLVELQFTEKKYVKVNPEIFRVIYELGADKLRESSHGSVIGHQQDASELFTFMMEWLEIAITEAIFCHQNPEFSNQLDDNMVVAGSVSAGESDKFAPPPIYDPYMGPSTSSGHREAISRPNTPTKKLNTSGVGAGYGTLETVEENMDTSESVTSPDKPIPFENSVDVMMSPVYKPDDEEFLNVEKRVEFIQKEMAEMFSSVKRRYNEEEQQVTSQTISSLEMIHISVRYGNIHDGIECNLTQNSTDDDTKMPVYGFELYDDLPKVIFVGLTRYANDGIFSTKLNDVCKFPSRIFMDRYLKKNMNVIWEIRKQIKAYRLELSELQARMKGIREYPMENEASIQLTDAFKTVLNALNFTKDASPPGPFEDQNTFVPNQGKIFPDLRDEFTNLISEKLSQKLDTIGRAEKDFLNREAELKHLISEMYEIDELHKEAYDLHIVITHSGQLNSGHYWAYKLRHMVDGSRQWQNVNDDKVSPIEWEDMEKSVYGTGMQNEPSAYFLMYVRADEDTQMTQAKMDEKMSYEQLPSDLQNFVARDRKEFHDRLTRFREAPPPPPPGMQQYSTGLQSEKKTFGFSWYKTPDSQPQDVNANPTCLLTLPLNTQHFTELTKEESADLENKTQHMWHVISTMAPGRFADGGDLLNSHLRDMMVGQAVVINGKAYIENCLQYSITELTEIHENDVNQNYEKFILDYVSFCGEPASPNLIGDRFIVFAFTQFCRLEVPLLRYLMVRAMAVTQEMGVFQRKAAMEIADYMNLSNDKGHTLQRIAYFLSHLYETGIMAAWGCRLALHNAVQVIEGTVFGTMNELESCFTALIGCRNARVCFRIMNSMISCMDSDRMELINTDYLEYACLNSALVISKLMWWYIFTPKYQLREMACYSKALGRRVNFDEVLAETKRAWNCLVQWQTQANDRGDDEGRIEIYNMIIESFRTKLSLYSTSPKAATDKLSCVIELQEAMTNENLNLETASKAVINCDVSSGQNEISRILQLYQLANKMHPLNIEIQKFLEKCEGPVSSYITSN